MNTIVINSIEEFLANGGEPQHYLGRAVYCWRDVEFPTDWDGRTPPTIRHVLYRCGDHPVVVQKKLELQELKERLSSLQREIRAMDISIYNFEKGRHGCAGKV